ncbi:unnamed protein product [Caretta caretta]
MQVEQAGHLTRQLGLRGATEGVLLSVKNHRNSNSVRPHHQAGGQLEHIVYNEFMGGGYCWKANMKEVTFEEIFGLEEQICLFEYIKSEEAIKGYRTEKEKETNDPFKVSNCSEHQNLKRCGD